MPGLLLYATQAYWHDVEARFADDWPAMIRGVAALSESRVEDYVSALASGGPCGPGDARPDPPATGAAEAAGESRIAPSERSMQARLVAGLVGMAVWTPGAQAPDLSLRIVSPGPDTYLSGPVLLKALVEPAPRAREAARVLFYADGRLVCNIVDVVRAECPWDAGAEVKEHLIRVVADLDGGGRLVSTARTKALDLAERVTVDVVQLTAVVNDGTRFVKGLARDRFRVLEDGVPQTVTHFSNEGSPLELVVAIDVSQSMAPNMPQLKNAVRKFLAALGPNDQVTLAPFNDNLFTLARRETVPAARLRAVDRLAPWGGTALFDVIVRGVQLLSKQPGRRVLVVFSDGDDRSSHATIGNVEDVMRSTDTTLFMVALGRGAREAQLRSGVQRLVTLSGGRGLFVERSDKLEDAFAEIVEELSNQYLLGYQSTNTRHDGTWREIAVDLPGTGHTVRARQGYRAPGGE
ncbi:MAG: VWA domain-containing protein [Vicinamibacterales bacterium]